MKTTAEERLLKFLADQGYRPDVPSGATWEWLLEEIDRIHARLDALTGSSKNEPAEELRSISTFQIAGRGTVKVLRVTDVKREYRIGEPIRIDGADWTISGIESTLPRRQDGMLGVIVRAKPSEPPCPRAETSTRNCPRHQNGDGPRCEKCGTSVAVSINLPQRRVCDTCEQLYQMDPEDTVR